MPLANLQLDLRYALRALRRDAVFAGFALLVTALGIGASITVFSVVHTLLLRPLPFEAPDRLVWIANGDGAGLSEQTTQVGHMLDLSERTRTLSAVAGYFAFYGVGDNLLTGSGGEPERLSGVPVSQNFFEVLGVTPALGRSFTPEEAVWNGPKVVMLDHGLWRRRFDADTTIIGRGLTINGESYTVVGVLPADFDFGTVFAPGSHLALYFPFPLSPETDRWGNTMAMIGRLAPGATVDQARAEIGTLAPQITADAPNRNAFGGRVAPLAEQISGPVARAIWVLAGAVAVVMLIVCANLGSLLLARLASRHKDQAIRAALGAGRGRLVAQSLTEGVLLASTGAALGVGVAAAATSLLSRLDAISIPLLHDVALDGTALAFAAGLAVATGIVIGLVPVLVPQNTSLTDALKDASRGSTEGRERALVRQALVVAEVAFACVLLVGAGLLVRSLVRVLEVDRGFVAERAATLRVDPDERVTTADQRRAYIDEVLRLTRDVPGVTAAGISDSLPLGRNRTWGARAKGVVYERGQAPLAYPRIVSDGYLAALGVPVLAGRDLTPHDTPDTEPVMLVNETMARTLWPGQDAIGKYVLGPCAAERRVVGVVADVRHLALEAGSGNEMYLPLRQCTDMMSVDLVVRSAMSPDALARAVRGALAPLGTQLPRNDFRTLQQIVDRSTSPRRFIALLLGGFALFALLLASLGLYALISYSVHQRQQEIGIRMTLGASAADVRRQVMAQTLRLAAMGIALGAAASWWLVRAVAGLLYGVEPRDPATFAAMSVLLGLVALLAGYVPARRASRVDPMVALRTE